MCRLMISSLPATVSNRHWPAIFTSGIGIGQLFGPTSSVIFAVPSGTSRQPCAKVVANLWALFASWTASPVSSALNSGPKIARKAA